MLRTLLLIMLEYREGNAGVAMGMEVEPSSSNGDSLFRVDDFLKRPSLGNYRLLVAEHVD